MTPTTAVAQPGSVAELPNFNGFLYNPKFLIAPNRFLPQAVQGILPFNTYKYQPRFFTAQPIHSLLGAGLTIDTQMRMVPGSVIVGFRIATTAGFPANQLSYLVRDSNTGLNFTDGKSRYVNCASLVPNGASGAAFCPLVKPYHVGGGVVVVSVSNQSTTVAVNFQLLVYVLEPVQSPTADATGSVQVPFAAALPVAGKVS